MAHGITQVERGGIAWRHGLRAGDTLLAINGEEIIDQVDYQALTAQSRLSLLVRTAAGHKHTIALHKQDYEPLGLRLADSLLCAPRACRNKCVFCFIDQMPKGLRPSLYVKDDDWRLSLVMGNFITLTNVDDAEFARILRRRASPLFISVHATDPAVRVRMMRNPAAAHLMERLRALAQAGIRFHCQIVLCPGYNDGAVLENTLRDLTALYPAAQSAALVPVGLTKCREGLAPLVPFDGRGAQAVLDFAHDCQRACLARYGTRFVFPADEFYCIAGADVPENDAYEDYPQIENGVGLLRMMEDSLADAARTLRDLPVRARRVLIPTGASVAPYMRRWLSAYGPRGVTAAVQPIRNTFFGESVTVTGLITGGDLAGQLSGAQTDEILISRSMLRAEGDLFLDDMPLSDLRALLPAPLTVVENDGESLYAALCGQATE